MQTLYALFFQIQVFLYALLNDSVLIITSTDFIITSTDFQNFYFTIRLSILLFKTTIAYYSILKIKNRTLFFLIQKLNNVEL